MKSHNVLTNFEGGDHLKLGRGQAEVGIGPEGLGLLGKLAQQGH